MPVDRMLEKMKELQLVERKASMKYYDSLKKQILLCVDDVWSTPIHSPIDSYGTPIDSYVLLFTPIHSYDAPMHAYGLLYFSFYKLEVTCNSNE